MKKFENYAASNFNKNWSNLIKRESPLYSKDHDILSTAIKIINSII